MPQSRRSFNKTMLGSIVTYGLIEMLAGDNLFADSVKPIINRWMLDLHNLGKDLKDHKLKDTDFQAKLEELYKRVELSELIKLVQLDKLSKGIQLPDKGEKSLGIDLSKVEGLPRKLVFGKQIFALKKGRSVVPHG